MFTCWRDDPTRSSMQQFWRDWLSEYLAVCFGINMHTCIYIGKQIEGHLETIESLLFIHGQSPSKFSHLLWVISQLFTTCWCWQYFPFPRFSHLVNIEYFADLLTVLGSMMNEGSLKLRESLHCIQVVFSILAGQGQVLTLDPTSFYQYLYANFYNISAGIIKSAFINNFVDFSHCIKLCLCTITHTCHSIQCVCTCTKMLIHSYHPSLTALYI